MPSNILQDYLEMLAEPGEFPARRRRKVLFSYAELQYRLHGGGRCAMCHAAVRYLLPVHIEYSDGSIAEYVCLCTRCMEGERAKATRITLTIGTTILEYGHGGTRPAQKKRKAARGK